MSNFRRHTVPVFVAMLIGLVAGSWRSSAVVRESDYLGLHMYHSVLLSIVSMIDGYFLRALLVALPLYILLEIMDALRRWERHPSAWLFIPAFACTAAACRQVQWPEVLGALAEIKRTLTTQGVMSADNLRLFGAALLLIGLIVFTIRKMKSQPVMESAAPPTHPKAWHDWSTRKAAEYTARRCRAVGMVILSLFLLVNAAFGISYVRNALILRSTPNIIYIMVDTLRADHLGCYGYSRNTSPNIDHFAEGAIRFDKAISQASWTTPSVTSFMTSRYIPIGMEHVDWAPLNIPLMPQILKDKGYVTSGVVSNQIAGSSVYLNRGYDWFSEYFGAGARGVTSPEVTRRALARIRETRGKRFFMFAHFMDPHDPYILHKGFDFYPDYKGRYPKDKMVSTVCSGDDLKHVEALYDSEVAFTDHYVGMIFDALKKQGLYDNSLIVVLADHGEEFCDHGGIKHGLTLYDEQLHVPLIIKLPGQRQGRVVTGNFPLIDLLPSVLKYTGADTSALRFQGAAVSLDTVKVMRDSAVYSSTNTGPISLSALRCAGWKIIKDKAAGTYKLYDLANDPRERHDLAGSKPDVLATLREQVTKMDTGVLAALGDPKTWQDSPDQGKGLETGMRALGYLQ